MAVAALVAFTALEFNTKPTIRLKRMLLGKVNAHENSTP
jgi:hypothetical protein